MTRTIQIDLNLRTALQSIPHATAVPCVTNDLPSIILKCEQRDLQSLRRPNIRIRFTPQLALYPTAAVFRLEFAFYDRTDPYTGDAFLNPSKEPDLALLRLFVDTPHVDFHLFDMRLNYAISKRLNVGEATRNDLRSLIVQALTANAIIEQHGKFDYDRALAELREATA